MYRKTLLYSLKYFFLSPLSIILFLVSLLVALSPLLLAKTPSVPICLYDLDNSAESLNVVNTLSKYNGIKLFELDIQSARRSLETGSIEAIFEIKPGFGENITRGEYENLVYMQLSKYSRGGRTISDAVAAAVMQEYAKHTVYNGVLEQTKDADLADLAVANAAKNDSVLIMLSENGKTDAEKDSGVSNSILYLSALICAFALCFCPENNSAVSQKLISAGKNFGLTVCIRNFGKLIPIMLLFLIPIITGNENIVYLCALTFTYTAAVSALSALFSNMPLTLKLNIAVVYSLINAVFTLSALFESPVAYLFPGHILSLGIKTISVMPIILMLILIAVFSIPALIYRPVNK